MCHLEARVAAREPKVFPIVWYETLGSAKRKKNDRVWEVRAHLGRDPITAISGN